MKNHRSFKRICCVLSILSCTGFSAGANGTRRIYELWEPAPAPNRGHDMWIITHRGYGYDKDWEEWSYPVGNGAMGANVFGRVDTERVQITEKTIHNIGVYDRGGLTGFANLFLDFNHENISGYRRSLNLNDAIAHVRYQSGDVNYTRQYFMSYPDNVLVIRLDADQKGALSFTLRPEIAYLDQEDRTGSVTASGDVITLKGHMPYLDINFEGQVKVLHEGGTLQPGEGEHGGQIKVSNADSVTLIFAAGTNYELSEKVFRPYPENKLDPNKFPHNEVSARIEKAAGKGFSELRQTHLRDYRTLFGRVALNLNSEPSELPTHELLYNYRFNQKDTWLEELVFQHARYMLIASSRENTLPANLQGAWSQYYFTPWTGGFWHNINVQMNYWGAMSANLAETFTAYIDFYKAYLPRAKQLASEYVEKYAPEKLSDEPGANGWVIGSGANAYFIPAAAESHSGPGTGGLTAKLFMDYFYFTQDETYLEKTGYPAMLGISRFFSKALRPEEDGTLLVYPSASPEIRVYDTNTLDNIENPGEVRERGYYITKGCTFDQSAVWESYK
ncbi:MAG TPA: glycoside hydrolase family 95 protein, partial [Tichowtungia sp.]|nr:glycoside hydrolase family 95 protein [Tichowtungia sp.]